MFIASVATVSLAVFTDLSIMELDNAELVLVRDSDPAIQTVAVPTAVEPADDTQEQGDATASIWAKGAVKKHRTRN